MANRELASDMLSAALEWGESHGAVPCMVAGDINKRLYDLDVVTKIALSNWLDMGTWPTSLNSCVTQVPRRIDVLLASPALQARIGAYKLRWDTTAAQHAYQEVSVELGVMQDLPVWHKSKQFPEPTLASEGTREERKKKDRAGRSGAFFVAKAKWATSLEGAGRDIEKYWAALEGLTCDFHGVRGDQPMDEPRPHGSVQMGQQFPETGDRGDALSCSFGG